MEGQQVVFLCVVSGRGQYPVPRAAARASMDDNLGTGSRGRENVVAISMRAVELRDSCGFGDHLYAGCRFKADRSNVMMAVMVRRRFLNANYSVIH